MYLRYKNKTESVHENVKITQKVCIKNIKITQKVDIKNVKITRKYVLLM